MRFSKRISLLPALLVLWGSGVQAESQAPSATTPTIEYVAPESIGLVPEKIEALKQGMQAIVDQGTVAGMTTMLARDGKVGHFETYGLADIAEDKPVEKDMIFRIYSMTKPITGVAMMVLFEEGKWQLDDPVSKYIPEFAGLKVANGVDEAGNLTTEDMVGSMTMRQLMSHTAGFSYGFAPEADPVDKLYAEQQLFGPGKTLDDMIAGLAAVPLAFQPGTQWRYSIAVDIQGYIVEKLSGQSLIDFFKARIFDPLGMADTDFYVPAEKMSRFGELYVTGEDGKLKIADSPFISPYTEAPTLPSGGGGLVSTSEDYMKFALMLLGEGEFGGVRILKPETVKLMHTNQLPDTIPHINLGPDPWEGVSFGLDFGIIHDPAKRGNAKMGAGSYTWGGAAGTWFWVDPVNDLTFVGMIQLFGSQGEMIQNSADLVYEALAAE